MNSMRFLNPSVLNIKALHRTTIPPARNNPKTGWYSDEAFRHSRQIIFHHEMPVIKRQIEIMRGQEP